jgi:hypothetical protein
MTDMGPESLGNVIAEASMSSLKLMEIANFLNGRERHFVQERSTMEKKVQSLERSYKKMDAELKKARLSHRELEATYEAYKDKYQLQVELTQTLASKEAEVGQLLKEKEEWGAKVADLEGQLQKLVIPDEEEKEADTTGEFANVSRGSLIRQLVDAQSSASRWPPQASTTPLPSSRSLTLASSSNWTGSTNTKRCATGPYFLRSPLPPMILTVRFLLVIFCFHFDFVLALCSPMKHFGVCSPFCNDNGAVLVTVYNICILIYILHFILSIILNDFTLVTVISMMFGTLTCSFN